MWIPLSMNSFQSLRKVLSSHFPRLVKDPWSDKMVDPAINPLKLMLTMSLLGFYVRPGTETLVSMKASRTVMNQDAIDFFSNPAQRMCYTENQFQPLYYNKVRSGFKI